MAENEKKEGQESQDKTPGSKLKFIIIGLAVFLLLIGVGAGAYLLGSKTASSAPAPQEAAEGTNDPEPIMKPVEKLGPMVTIEEFVINLLDKEINRYLKATMTIEAEDDDTAAEIQDRMPQVRDAVLLLTGNKTFGELRDLQGKMQLRAELAGHINTLLQKGKVKRIYFTNFVIQ